MADDEKNPKENTEKDPENPSQSDEKVNDAEVKDAKKKDAGKAKEKKEKEDDDESSEEEELFGLYDKPLVVEGKRQRKRTDFLVKDQEELKKEPQPLLFNGKGETLGSMEVVNHELSRCTGLELKPLHKLLFGRDGRLIEIKKNIRAFNGFSFEEGTKEYENKKFMVERFTNEGLKRLLEILDLEKKGTREDLKERVFTFLMKPKGSGRTVKPAKKKAKKSKPKSKGKGEKRKRTSTKAKKSSEKVKDDDDDGDDDDEEEEQEEESEEEEPKKKKSKSEGKEREKSKGSPKKTPIKATPIKATKEASKSDKKEKAKPEKKESAKKETKKDSKKTKSKPVTVKITSGKRSPKKSPKKVEKPADDDESSSDDEPLAKKIKKQPPTNEELANVVKDILKDADLDQVTVKSIGKQVFSKYPDFDLSDRKGFIKETVYSIISGDAD